MDLFGEKIEQLISGCLDFIIFDHVQPDDVLPAFAPCLQSFLRPYLEAASWLLTQRVLCSPAIGFVVNSKRHITDLIRFEQGDIDFRVRSEDRLRHKGH